MSITAKKLPLPHHDGRKKKLPRRCRTAMVYKNKLPRRCRAAMAYKLAAAAPLLRWFSKKCSKFPCRDCIGPEILVLDHKIDSVSGCFICKH
jgi:hypothetical protein